MALRTFARLTIVSVLALAACGAEQSPEQLVTKQIAVTQEFGQVLAKITDRASAKQHKSEVKSLVKQINALRKDIQELPEDVRKVCFELAAERGPELQSALAKMRSELTRIEPSAEIQGVIGLWLDML
jgi:TolA-binding protein